MGKTGAFDVTEDMIGFNNEGVAKVWMNADWREIVPEFQGGVRESEMVQRVIEIVDGNTDQESVPQNIASYLRGKKARTMKEAGEALE